MACSSIFAATAIAQKAPGKAAAQPAAAQKAEPVALKSAGEPVDEVHPSQSVSENVIDVAGWVIASGDNRELPFAVVDKRAAQILVFAADGKLRGLAPVLIGSARGDHSAPGVGDRELADIPAEDRTTPAGRFLAAYGPAVGGERVLWVDYNTAVSIHARPITPVSRKERREERLLSPMPEDNRITHGCINVSPEFYDTVVKPLFQKTGGVFYVLPDTMALSAALPGFQASNDIASREANMSAAPGLIAR